MHAKLQRRIQRYGWDKAADVYEQHWQQQLAPAQTRLFEMADIRPGERVLDVACGTGLVTCRVARQVGEHGTVVGVDGAGKMVAYAQQVAANLCITRGRLWRGLCRWPRCPGIFALRHSHTPSRSR